MPKYSPIGPIVFERKLTKTLSVLKLCCAGRSIADNDISFARWL